MRCVILIPFLFAPEIAGAGAAVLLLAAILLLRARRNNAFLEVVAGPAEGVKHPVEGSRLRIGTVAAIGGHQNDLVVANPTRLISRSHCEVRRRGNRFYVIDLGSTNGTFLDRREIPPRRPVRMRPGSVVNLAGVLQMRLSLERRSSGRPRKGPKVQYS